MAGKLMHLRVQWLIVRKASVKLNQTDVGCLRELVEPTWDAYKLL